MRGKGKFHFKQESQARRQENAIHHPVMYSIGTSQNHTGEIFEINTKKIMSSRQAAVLHLITVCWQFISVFHFVACPKQFTKFCQYAQQYDLIALVQKGFHWCKMIKDSSVWICWILVAEVPLSLWAAKQKAFLFSSFHTIFFFLTLLYGCSLHFLNATDCLSASELALHPSSDGNLFRVPTRFPQSCYVG